MQLIFHFIPILSAQPFTYHNDVRNTIFILKIYVYVYKYFLVCPDVCSFCEDKSISTSVQYIIRIYINFKRVKICNFELQVLYIFYMYDLLKQSFCVCFFFLIMF